MSMFTKICDQCLETLDGDCYETYANFVPHDLHFCNDACLHEWIKTKIGASQRNDGLIQFDREYKMRLIQLVPNMAAFKKEHAGKMIRKIVSEKIESPVLKAGVEQPKIIMSHKPFHDAWLLLARISINLNNYETKKSA